MNGPPEVIAELRRWIEKAEADLRTAEYLLTMKERCPFDVVCFHSQQCAEKYLKALLVQLDSEFPKTHDLVVLFNLARDKAGLILRVEDVQPLNRYSIEARYPGEWEPIDGIEAGSAVTMAGKVRAAVRPLLPAQAFEDQT
jgi:HEPN domain-containing protein